jgi:hypothetical protein
MDHPIDDNLDVIPSFSVEKHCLVEEMFERLNNKTKT